MGFNEFLTKLFGNKAQRDLKEISPYVEKVKEAYPAIKALSNDGLRQKSSEIRTEIQNSVAAERDQIVALKADIEEMELEKRETVYNEVDKLEKLITEKLEKALDDALPEVFAIVKDTARRFVENKEIVVTATDFDKDLAAKHDFVNIKGDKAIYLNHWIAGGNDMGHGPLRCSALWWCRTS
jgi:preprotein translocase subunit SecA